jgi:hypothetical protein
MQEEKTKVVNEVTTKKKYVKPECESIELDVQPRLLAASEQYGMQFSGAGRSMWDEDE